MPPTDMPPPMHSITMATPRLAPASMPSMEGPASGLRKAVCNSRPQVLRAAPQSRAVTICGMRFSHTMKCHAGWSGTSLPQSMCQTVAAGMDTLPQTMLAAASIARARISRGKTSFLSPCPWGNEEMFVLIFLLNVFSPPFPGGCVSCVFYFIIAQVGAEHFRLLRCLGVVREKSLFFLQQGRLRLEIPTLGFYAQLGVEDSGQVFQKPVGMEGRFLVIPFPAGVAKPHLRFHES